MEPKTAPLSRADRLETIALAPEKMLKQLWEKLGLDPDFKVLRGPETGLVALKGRIGGGGAPFPFGDATATRTSVRIDDGRIGHALLLGRDHARTTIAAVIDALSQDPADAETLDSAIIQPLRNAISEHDKRHASETEATKVDFFTMVRGED